MGKPPKLPKYIVLKKGEWHVRRVFPTEERDEKGNTKYLAISRKCEPPTAERAAEIAMFIEHEYKAAATPRTVETLADFFQHFFDAKRLQVSARTLEFYEDVYSRTIKTAAINFLDIRSITPLHVQMFYNNLKCPSSTARKASVILAMALRQAKAWKLIDEDPSEHTTPPKHVPKETNAFTKAEAIRFIQTCHSDIRFAALDFLLETGVRIQEALALTWDDVDLEGRAVMIDKALVKGHTNHWRKIGSTKTVTSKGVIRISPELADRLRLLLAERDVEMHRLRVQIAAPIALSKSRGYKYQERKRTREYCIQRLENITSLNLVFPGKDGALQNPDSLNRHVFKSALELTGIDKTRYSLESLRHTCATLLADHVHIKRLQRRLRHASPATTAKFYIHADDGMEAETSEIIAELLYR